jgi:methylated-DNA-[protein]-cysteine S-methyltransferase
MLVESPVGPLLLGASDDALSDLRLPDVADDGTRAPSPGPGWPASRRPTPLLQRVAEQLEAYFTGELTQFDVPLLLQGTAFQQRVWQELREIPYGSTATYGEIAERLGSPGASRAVGLANNRNPVPIIVPCHRVVGADGALVGFGGGLPCKRWLLDHESARDQLFSL